MSAKIEDDQKFDYQSYRPESHRPEATVVRALRYCFGFTGRFNRANFWIGYGIAFAMTMVAIISGETITPNNNVVEIVGGLWCLLWLVSILAVATKRLHDLDYSGLLLVAYFAATTAAEILLPGYRAYNGIVAGICLIWLGAAPGEKKPNRFGSGVSVHTALDQSSLASP